MFVYTEQRGLRILPFYDAALVFKCSYVRNDDIAISSYSALVMLGNRVKGPTIDAC